MISLLVARHPANRRDSTLALPILKDMNFSIIPPVIEPWRKSGSVFHKALEAIASEGRIPERIVRIQEPRLLCALVLLELVIDHKGAEGDERGDEDDHGLFERQGFADQAPE